MPRCLHHIDGKFRLWSSIVDAYVGPVMSKREALTDEEVGGDYEARAARVDRAQANGCSYVQVEDRCKPIPPFDADLVVSRGVVLQTKFCSHHAGLTAWMGCSFCDEAQRNLEKTP